MDAFIIIYRGDNDSYRLRSRDSYLIRGVDFNQI